MMVRIGKSPAVVRRPGSNHVGLKRPGLYGTLAIQMPRPWVAA